MLGERDIFGRGAEGAAVALAVEEPDPLTDLEPRDAAADLVDDAGAVAVGDHARKFHRAIAAGAAADIGGIDAGGLEPDADFARSGLRRRHLAEASGHRRRARCARTRPPSQRAREGAAVEQDVLAGDEARLGAAEERAGRAEFLGIAEASGGIELGAFRQQLFDGDAALLGLRLRPVPRSRSVSNGPGNRPLMVTLLITVLRAMPATKPVRPARAPLDSPRISIGAFTAAEVMLTMRPNLRAIMPSTVALISSIGVSMLASSALIQSSRVQLRKSPGGGPPALLTRISGSGQAFSAASRPAGRGDVAGDLGHGHAGIGFAYFGGGFRQRFGAARGHRDMHAFVGQRHRAGASQALAGCADDGAAAFDPKIHCLTPVMSGDCLKSDPAIVANPDGPDKGLRICRNAYQGGMRRPRRADKAFICAGLSSADRSRRRPPAAATESRFVRRPTTAAAAANRSRNAGWRSAWHELIEDQHQRDRDQADAHRAERGAGEAIADAGAGADGFVEHHAHQLSQHHAGEQKNSEEQRPVLRSVARRPAADLRATTATSPRPRSASRTDRPGS